MSQIPDDMRGINRGMIDTALHVGEKAMEKPKELVSGLIKNLQKNIINKNETKEIKEQSKIAKGFGNILKTIGDNAKEKLAPAAIFRGISTSISNLSKTEKEKELEMEKQNKEFEDQVYQSDFYKNMQRAQAEAQKKGF